MFRCRLICVVCVLPGCCLCVGVCWRLLMFGVDCCWSLRCALACCRLLAVALYAACRALSGVVCWCPLLSRVARCGLVLFFVVCCCWLLVVVVLLLRVGVRRCLSLSGVVCLLSLAVGAACCCVKLRVGTRCRALLPLWCALRLCGARRGCRLVASRRCLLLCVVDGWCLVLFVLGVGIVG